MTTQPYEKWQSWIGREELRHDYLEPAAARRWLATFDRVAPADGSVPQGYHWCLCLPEAPTAALSVDGHPVRGGESSFMPPLPQSRRMWASSRIEFLSPLLIGQKVQRRSRINSIAEKQGATGKLVFVEMAQETHCKGELFVRETQAIVYRAPMTLGPAEPPKPCDMIFDGSRWDAHRALIPSETLLFRFSALTFNSHRIHYDRAYTCEIEGYRGLVVHGPLTATLLLELAQQHFGDNALRCFDCRAVSAAICGEELHLALRANGDSVQFVAYARDGRSIMVAKATL